MARAIRLGNETAEMVSQINVRLKKVEIDRIDDRRVDEKTKTGVIPSRSDIVRDALTAYLNRGRTKQR